MFAKVTLPKPLAPIQYPTANIGAGASGSLARLGYGATPLDWLKGIIGIQVGLGQELIASRMNLSLFTEKATNALQNADAAAARIEALQASAGKSMKKASRLQSEVQSQFRKLAEAAKAGNKEAEQTAKTALMSKGKALAHALGAVEGIYAKVEKELAEVEKQLKAVKKP